MGATGSSDAHQLATLGCYFTEFDRPIDTLADFVAALRARACRPRHREGVRLTSGPVSESPKGPGRTRAHGDRNAGARKSRVRGSTSFTVFWLRLPALFPEIAEANVELVVKLCRKSPGPLFELDLFRIRERSGCRRAGELA